MPGGKRSDLLSLFDSLQKDQMGDGIPVDPKEGVLERG